MPSSGHARTSQYSASIRSSIAIWRCLASRASTRRPGGPNGDRRPETRTLSCRSQTGASLTFRPGETACAAPPRSPARCPHWSLRSRRHEPVTESLALPGALARHQLLNVLQQRGVARRDQTRRRRRRGKGGRWSWRRAGERPRRAAARRCGSGGRRSWPPAPGRKRARACAAVLSPGQPRDTEWQVQARRATALSVSISFARASCKTPEATRLEHHAGAVDRAPDSAIIEYDPGRS